MGEALRRKVDVLLRAMEFAAMYKFNQSVHVTLRVDAAVRRGRVSREQQVLGIVCVDASLALRDLLAASHATIFMSGTIDGAAFLREICAGEAGKPTTVVSTGDLLDRSACVRAWAIGAHALVGTFANTKTQKYQLQLGTCGYSLSLFVAARATACCWWLALTAARSRCFCVPLFIFFAGWAIHHIARRVARGVVVFFPSYRVLELCRTAWKKTVMSALKAERELIFEPKSACVGFLPLSCCVFRDVH